MSEDILSRKPPPPDQRVAYGSDPNQFFELRFPPIAGKPSDRPLVINIHGGYWRAKYNLDHAGHLCAALTAEGIVTANLEYRRVGNVGGGWPGTFEDIRGAYHFLVQHAREYHVDPRKAIVMGHSAGGQLALCLAAHEPALTAAVSLAGVVDLQGAFRLHLSNDAVVEFLRGTPAEVPEHYHEADPMRLAITHAKQWLIHGLSDDVVPPAFSLNYVVAKSKKEDAHLLEIARADHFDLIDPQSATWKQVRDAVTELLSAAT